jgi:hypothetical protein
MQRAARTVLRVTLGCSGVLVLLFAAFVAWAHLSMGPLKYTALPITATVIDEATGRPVEGAVVAARWRVKKTLGYPLYMHVAETKTGPDGVFHFEGWGPEWRPAFSAFQDEDPNILIYKPGYRAGGGTNYQANVRAMTVVKRDGEKIVLAPPLHPGQRIALNEFDYSRDSVRVCYWNGKQMPLEPARSAADELDAIQFADYAVSDAEEDREPSPGHPIHSPFRLPLLTAAMADGWYRLPEELRAKTTRPASLPAKPEKTSHAQ